MERDYKKCDICKNWHWINDKCPPIFYFKHENWGDELQEIRAYGFDSAAEEFAKLYNTDSDYALMNDNQDVIISDGKVEKKYNVSAEPDVHYSVKEIEQLGQKRRKL